MREEEEALIAETREYDPGWGHAPDEHDIEPDYGPGEDIDPEERCF